MTPSAPLTADALAEALALAGVGCWQWHAADRQLQVSANFHQLLGSRPETLPATREAWLARTHADERPQLAKLFDKLENGTAHGLPNFALRLQHANGRWHSFDVRLPGHGAPHTPLIVTFNEIARQSQIAPAPPWQAN